MQCRVCGDESTGQCQGCWEFYCAHHSHVVCDECAKAEVVVEGRVGHVRVIAKQLEDDDRARREAFEAARPDPTKLMRWIASGRDRLDRVIGVAQTQTTGDAEVTLLSVELYNGGFVLNYRIRSLQAKNAMRQGLERRLDPADWPDVGVPHAAWEASDDEGNKYETVPMGSGGGGGELRGSTAFFPELSGEAKRLTISANKVHWIGSTSDTRPEESGPWRFEIPLT